MERPQAAHDIRARPSRRCTGCPRLGRPGTARYHHRVQRRRLIAAFLLIGLAGCASNPREPAELSVAPGDYPRAFEAAKNALRDFEFELDRVDARAGIIVTAPRSWSGAATPWLPYDSSPGDGIEGLFQFEHRIARVDFSVPDPAPADLRDAQEPLTAKIVVTVERLYRPGRRVDATSVRLTGFTSDPRVNPSGPAPAFAVEHRSDLPLAARIQAAMDRELASTPNSAADEPPTTQP